MSEHHDAPKAHQPHAPHQEHAKGPSKSQRDQPQNLLRHRLLGARIPRHQPDPPRGHPRPRHPRRQGPRRPHPPPRLTLPRTCVRRHILNRPTHPNWSQQPEPSCARPTASSPRTQVRTPAFPFFCCSRPPRPGPYRYRPNPGLGPDLSPYSDVLWVLRYGGEGFYPERPKISSQTRVRAGGPLIILGAPFIAALSR